MAHNLTAFFFHCYSILIVDIVLFDFTLHHFTNAIYANSYILDVCVVTAKTWLNKNFILISHYNFQSCSRSKLAIFCKKSHKHQQLLIKMAVIDIAQENQWPLYWQRPHFHYLDFTCKQTTCDSQMQRTCKNANGSVIAWIRHAWENESDFNWLWIQGGGWNQKWQAVRCFSRTPKVCQVA